MSISLGNSARCSAPEGARYLLPFGLPEYVPPEETGKTFEENAALKAVHAAKELDMLAVADDSELVVPSLKGRPGVRSRVMPPKMPPTRKITANFFRK